MEQQTSSASWHTLPERGTLLGMSIVLWFCRVLGPRLIWLLVYPILFYLFMTGKSARNSSRKYLARLADQGAAVTPSLVTQFRHFTSFAQAILDRLLIYQGKGGRFRLNWHGRDIIDSYLAQKRGVVLAGAHLGSFELLRLLADERDSERVHALMYTKQAKLMSELFKKERSGPDLSVIPLENMGLEQMLAMREITGRGEHIGVLADRPAASAADRTVSADFLGVPAPFPEGPWTLAVFLNAPILLIFGVRTGRDQYDIFCEEFPVIRNSRGKTDLSAMVEAYAKRLEHYAKTYPLQWFNFYDFWNEQYS